MSDQDDWEIPENRRPRDEAFGFDIDRTLTAVLRLETTVADDAFTANSLGTQRSGNGVLIREDGLVLTVGYLVTEAETLWLYTAEGEAVPAHLVGFDQETGFGLVQALRRLKIPPIEIGRSSEVDTGDPVVVAGNGGRRRAIAAHVVAKNEFAGYWEYLLDEAIFTAPAHPHWGGAAMLSHDGKLRGIGSLHVQERQSRGANRDVNMVVPIDLLTPILDDLLMYGRPNRPARPWLGVFTAESNGHVVVAGLAERGPAKRVGLQEGDVILAVKDNTVNDLAGLLRGIWSLGPAGIQVPLTIVRDGETRTLAVKSVDRSSILKGPRLH